MINRKRAAQPQGGAQIIPLNRLKKSPRNARTVRERADSKAK
jgi:hypothetical protein